MIETFNLSLVAPISTTGGVNAGAFRGIDVGSNIITRFEVVGGYAVADNLTFSRQTASVPDEAGHAGAMALGLLALGASFRRRG